MKTKKTEKNGIFQLFYFLIFNSLSVKLVLREIIIWTWKFPLALMKSFILQYKVAYAL